MTYVPETWVDYTTPCVDAAHLNAIEHGVDIAQGDVMVLRGLTANIPATDPELVGRLYIETDLLLRTWRDNGAGWDLAITPGAGGGVWVPIAETILGAPAATVTFAAIAGTYRDLYLFHEVRTDRADVVDYMEIQLNGDGGNNYDWYAHDSYENITTRGTTRGAATFGGQLCEGANSRASNFASGFTIFYSYARADREKTSFSHSGQVRGLNADDGIRVRKMYTHWNNTAAITQIALAPAVGANFVTGSLFTLYGIT